MLNNKIFVLKNICSTIAIRENANICRRGALDLMDLASVSVLVFTVSFSFFSRCWMLTILAGVWFMVLRNVKPSSSVE